MIDTVKLTLDKTMFTILDKSKFERDMMNSSRGYFTMVQNPTKQELKRGIYKPRLTVTNRFNASGRSEQTLSIEFSVPKLVYGNNFEELSDEDFDNVIAKLNRTLKSMGVFIFEDNLIDAPISSVHYSKNIPLTDYSLPYMYLSQLAKLNINKQLDTAQTDFRNEGHSFKYRANTFEIVFYDKLKDLKYAKVSDKRAIENDNAIQLDLYDVLREQNPYEVLRMEVRLNTRRKIGAVLRKVEKDVEITFKNIFHYEVSKAVLLSFIQEIEDAYPPLLMYEGKGAKSYFQGITMANPELKPTQALEMLGFRMLLDQIGVREYRELIGRHGDYYWYSLNNKMRNLAKPVEVNVFDLLKREVKAFEPLRVAN